VTDEQFERNEQFWTEVLGYPGDSDYCDECRAWYHRLARKSVKKNGET
jgi:hypothetical protein